MRFFSLYSYSLWKAPSDLRWAIVACRLALILSGFSAILFLLSGVILFQTAGNHSSNVRFNNQEPSSSSIIDNNSSEKIIHHDGEPDDSKTTATANFPPFVLASLLIGAILVLGVGISVIYALISYRNYRRSRMVAYEMVNRSFDDMQRQQMARTKIRQPIGEPESKEVITVIKVNHHGGDDNFRCKPNTGPKSTFWSRLKRQQHHHHNHYPYHNPSARRSQKPTSKEMTI